MVETSSTTQFVFQILLTLGSFALLAWIFWLVGKNLKIGSITLSDKMIENVLFFVTMLSIVIGIQTLFPEFWEKWGWSPNFWLVLVMSIVLYANIILKNNKIFIVILALLILSIAIKGIIKSVDEIGQVDTYSTTPAHLDEVGEIMAQQNRMEEYYGTFHCTAGSDTSYLFVPAYSILNIKMPVGKKLSVTDGRGKHYLYDGYIVTMPDGSMPRDEEKLQFGVGDMYYKICNPTTINVTYLVRKKNRVEIQEALNQQ